MSSEDGASVVTRIYIEPLRTGARCPRSRVHLGSPNGPVLVKATIQPLLDGTRALLSRGITGSVECWDNIRPYPRMRGSIEQLSKLAVKENQNVSPTFVPYEPFPVTRCSPPRAKRNNGEVSKPEKQKRNPAPSPVTENGGRRYRSQNRYEQRRS
jgi:hypothetical protein